MMGWRIRRKKNFPRKAARGKVVRDNAGKPLTAKRRKDLPRGYTKKSSKKFFEIYKI